MACRAALCLLALLAASCGSSPTAPRSPQPLTGLWGGVARITSCRSDDFRTCSRIAQDEVLELTLIQLGNTISGEILLLESSTVAGAGTSPIAAQVTGAVDANNDLSLDAQFGAPPAPHYVAAWRTRLMEEGYAMSGTFSTYRRSGSPGLSTDLTFELLGVRRKAMKR